MLTIQKVIHPAFYGDMDRYLGKSPDFYVLFECAREFTSPGLVHDEDYAFTHHIEVISSPNLTRWEVIRFSLVLEANETVTLGLTSYDPQGNIMENWTFTLNSGARREWHYEIASLGTYKFEIKKHTMQDVLINMLDRIEKWVFERKYFYYGIAGIVAPCPTVPLAYCIIKKFLRAKYKNRSVFGLSTEG